MKANQDTLNLVTPTQLKDEIKVNAKAGDVTMISGPPGIGKSQIVAQVGKELGAEVFDLRANLFDPVDVRGGLKLVEQPDGTYRTKYGIPEDYPDPNYEGTVILNLEELNTAVKATMNALLQLVLDRRIGAYHLPRNTIIVATGNRIWDRAAVNEMPTSLKDRMAHYTLQPNIDDWTTWAIKNNIDESIISFLRFAPQNLHNMDPYQDAFPTPRAWEKLNAKLPFMVNPFITCAGSVGVGTAVEYLAHKEIYEDLPDLDKLIKSPHNAKTFDNTALNWAITTGLVLKTTLTNLKQVIKYIKRMPEEYASYYFKIAIQHEPLIAQSEAFQKWAEEDSQKVM